jgi:hypothetical protein
MVLAIDGKAMVDLAIANTVAKCWMVHYRMNIPKMIKSDEGWTVEGAGPSLLPDPLAEYEKSLAAAGFPLDVFVGGVDADQVREWIPAGLWATGWLALESGSGLAVYCDRAPESPCLVRRNFSDEWDFVTEYAPFQTVSLCTVVSWWIEALSTRAIWRDSTGSGWECDVSGHR